MPASRRGSQTRARAGPYSKKARDAGGASKPVSGLFSSGLPECFTSPPLISRQGALCPRPPHPRTSIGRPGCLSTCITVTVHHSVRLSGCVARHEPPWPAVGLQSARGKELTVPLLAGAEPLPVPLDPDLCKTAASEQLKKRSRRLSYSIAIPSECFVEVRYV